MMENGLECSPEHIAYSVEQTEQDMCMDLCSQPFTLLQCCLQQQPTDISQAVTHGTADTVCVLSFLLC